MEQSQNRTATILAIKERIQRKGVCVSEQQALQLVLSAGTRFAVDLFGFIFDSLLARRASSLGEAASITPTEFDMLFGSRARATCEGGVGAVVASPEFAPHVNRLANALRCTVLEKEPASAWSRGNGKASTFYSLHASDTERMIKTSLGGFVHADMRRLEELSHQVDSDGPEIMLLAQCILALTRSVV